MGGVWRVLMWQKTRTKWAFKSNTIDELSPFMHPVSFLVHCNLTGRVSMLHGKTINEYE